MADQDKPTPVALNLDKLEREGTTEPFVIRLGGKRYTLLDARDIDVRILAATNKTFQQGDPEAAIAVLLHPKDREAFFANELPGFKVEALFNAYNEHHGIEPGELLAS